MGIEQKHHSHNHVFDHATDEKYTDEAALQTHTACWLLMCQSVLGFAQWIEDVFASLHIKSSLYKAITKQSVVQCVTHLTRCLLLLVMSPIIKILCCCKCFNATLQMCCSYMIGFLTHLTVICQNNDRNFEFQSAQSTGTRHA